MLQIFYDKHIYNATIETLKSIKRSQGVNHIVLTPDRMNQNIQNIIFDVLGADSLFDVDVTTLSRLANKVIDENNMSKTVLSKAGGIAIVRSIIQSHSDEFSVFAKQKNGASSIYDTIAQFKSCNVTPAMIKEKTSSDMLNSKLDDIAKIYEYYEEYLQGEFTDSFNRLRLFCELTKRIDYKNTYFYFVGFSELTNLQFDVIFALEKASRGVFVSTIYDKGNNICPNNTHINLLDYARVNNIPFISTPSKIFLPQPANAILSAWNSNGIKKAIDITVGCGITTQDEIEYVARYIKQEVMKGNRFKDYVVLCSNIAKYKDDIIKTFDKYNLPHFVDIATPLADTCGIGFLLQIFDTIKSNFDTSDILNLLSNIYLKYDREKLNDFANYCEKYDISFGVMSNTGIKEKYGDAIDRLLPIYNFAKTKSSKFGDINNEFRQLLVDLEWENATNDIVEQYINSEQFDKSREQAQIVTKLYNLLDELDKVIYDYECDVQEYFDILKSCINDMSVSIPPVVYDTIMIGDITTSSTLVTPNLIVLGAIEGEMPAYKMDLGIISDIDVQKLSFSSLINPTIALINKRNKYKNIMNLLMFSNSLLVTYPSIDSEGKPSQISAILARVMDIATFKFVNIANELSLYEDNILDEEKIVYHNLSLAQSKKNFVSTINSLVNKDGQNVYYGTLKKVLGSSAKIYEDSNIRTGNEKISDGQKLYFSSHASVSQFENYFGCPYRHFVSNGLKLKEKESNKIDARMLGNIIHAFVYYVVPKIEENKIGHYTKAEIESLSQKTIDFVFEKYKDYCEDVNNENNILSLRLEAKNVLTAILQQFELSTYRTNKNLLEYEFGPKQNNSIELKTKYKTVHVMGKVDRIDTLGNTFRIIDYKTGKSEFSYDEIANGKKLQLVFYLYAIQKILNMRPCGAFYMSIKNDYVKPSEKKSPSRLDGFYVKDKNDILNMDSSVSQSTTGKIIDAKFTSKGGIRKNKKALEPEKIEKLCQYVLDMMTTASENILSGDISHTPLKSGDKSECEWCKYKGMCPYISPRQGVKGGEKVIFDEDE